MNTLPTRQRPSTAQLLALACLTAFSLGAHAASADVDPDLRAFEKRQAALRALGDYSQSVRSSADAIFVSDFETVQASRRLRQPTDQDDDVLDLVRTLGARRWDRRVKLRLVGVGLSDLESARDRQLDFFEQLAEPTAERASTPHRSLIAGPGLAHRLDRAVDRIRERHGFGSLVRGRAIDLLPRAARD